MHENPADRSTTGKHPKRRSRSVGWRFVLSAVVVAALLTGLVRSLLVDVYFIPSGSMEPLLTEGDRVLVDKLVDTAAQLQRGDVVVFDGRGSFDPITDQRSLPEQLLAGAGQWLGVSGSHTVYIKRVIGLGGDHVECCSEDGHLLVNGDVLDEPYLYPGDNASDGEFDVVVPEGRIWLLGDHRSASQDSRSLLGAPGGGLIAEDRIIGRAFQLVWPLDRFAPIGRPDD
ncbi:signal peptidase I [Arthrobacter echini]|uniref:signal peptidase I n=1 Tax=Arthrobacter echini TaxID=1529066 RepID=UPI0021CD0C50|nr:signal peptidase I [Arthrobacter echini]